MLFEKQNGIKLVKKDLKFDRLVLAMLKILATIQTCKPNIQNHAKFHTINFAAI